MNSRLLFSKIQLLDKLTRQIFNQEVPMKSLSLLVLLLPTLILAENQEENGHENVGARTPVIVEPTEVEETESQASCGFIFDRFPQPYFSNNVHSIATISSLCDLLAIEDGSTWKLSGYDNYRALNWRSGDTVMITQNNRWFTIYPYRIVNQTTGSSIETSLFQGPHKNGEYSRYIQEIDFIRGLVMLNDNSYWEISLSDASAFKQWAANDSIIIGYNSGWDTSYEGLIINVTMNNNARARKF